jgi:hypothetical protein
MTDNSKQVIHSSWRMKDLSEDELLTILGCYNLGEKSPDEVYSLLQEIKNPNERESISLPSEESLFPAGFKDVLSDLHSLGASTWHYYKASLHEILCNKDGTCKYQFNFEQFESLIVVVSGIGGIKLPIAICLLLLVYKKGYPFFCKQIP